MLPLRHKNENACITEKSVMAMRLSFPQPVLGELIFHIRMQYRSRGRPAFTADRLPTS